jgi:23S rRNA (guanosine2251-2'-O)-methyltransferase
MPPRKNTRFDRRQPEQGAGKAKGRAGDHTKARGAKGKYRDTDGPLYLYGIHAVEAALNNPARDVLNLKLTPNAAQRLSGTLRNRDTKYEQVTPRDLDHLLGADCVHQGAVLETQALPDPDLTELADSAASGRPLLLLDQITDPHNLGAILRSCAVFGAAGLVTTRRNSPPLAGTVAKTASGGLEHVPVALVANLARAMGQLKDLGFQIIGLDGMGETLLHEADLSGPTAFVLGAENSGLRRLTRDNCDMICAIAAPGPIASLNVSNAAAVCLHLAALRRRVEN